MVDLGQKRWKKFRLFYFYSVESKIRKIEQRKILYIKKDGQQYVIRLFSLFFTLFYFSKANLLVTSVQLITLKKASI